MARRGSQSSAMLVRLLYDGSKAEADLGRSARKFESFANTVSTSLLAGGVIGAGLFGLGVREAAQFQEAQIALQKTSGLSRQAAFELAEELAGLRQEVGGLAPVSSTALVGIGALGAQFGVASSDLDTFVEGIGLLSIASSDLDVETAATGVAKFQAATGGSTRDTRELASSIVALGNNTAASEGAILSASRFLAAYGTVVGLTRAEILGLSAATESLGLRAESAGSSLSRTFAKIETAVKTGGKSLQQFADITGLSAEQFRAAFADDPATVIESFVSGLGDLIDAGTDVTAVLDGLGLGGQENLRTLSALAVGSEGVAKSLTIATDGYRDATAATEEAELQAQSFNNQVVTLREDLSDLGISVGADLLPVLSAAVSAARSAAGVFEGLPGPVRSTAVALGVTAAALALVTGAALKGRLALSQYQANLAILQSQLRTTATSATAANTAIGLTGRTAGLLARVAGPVGLALTGAAVLGTIAFGSFNKRLTETEQLLEGLADARGENSVDDLFSGAVTNAADEADNIREITFQIAALQDQLTFGANTADETRRLEANVAGLVAGLSEAEDRAAEAAEAVRDLAGELTGAELQFLIDQLAADLPVDVLQELEALYADRLAQDRDLRASSDAYAQSVAGVSEVLDEESTEVRSLADAYDDLTDARFDQVRSLDDVYDATQRVVDSLDRNGATLDVATEAGRRNREELSRAARAALDYGAGVAEATGSTAQGVAATKQWIGTLVAAATQNGLTTDEVYAYLNALGIVPANVATDLLVDESDAQAGINAVVTSLGLLPVAVDIPINIIPYRIGQAPSDQRLFPDELIPALTGGPRFAPSRTRGGRGGGGGGGGGGSASPSDELREELDELDRLYEFDRISRTEYVDGLTVLLASYGDLTDGWVEITRRLRSEEDDLAAEEQALADELERAAQDRRDASRRLIEDADQELRRRADELADGLARSADELRSASFQFADLISDFGGTAPDTDAIVDYLEHRVEAISRAQEGLSKLAQGGTDRRLVEQLAKSGVGAIGLIEALGGDDSGRINDLLSTATSSASGFAARFSPNIAGQIGIEPLLFGDEGLGFGGRTVSIGGPTFDIRIDADVAADPEQLADLIQTQVTDSLINWQADFVQQLDAQGAT